MATIIVTAGDAWLTDTAATDTLQGLPGQDAFEDLAGNDQQAGGEGCEQLAGRAAKDLLVNLIGVPPSPSTFASTPPTSTSSACLRPASSMCRPETPSAPFHGEES